MLTKNGIRNLKRYCREPIENIKGYKEAVEGKGRYDCHHINELTFTMDELIKMDMYYNRPASELVIMYCSDHKKWHHKWNGNPMTGRTGEKNPMYSRSSDRSPRWKGSSVGPQGSYKRALRLFRSGQITEAELQPYRDKWVGDQHARRNKKC